MSSLHKTNGRYLWWSLLGLGFQPDVAVSLGTSKVTIKHIILGPNMFDRPNKDAFYIVTHFLLEKLNPTRFQELYRHCWPVLDYKGDAEFRKVTCNWLRDIMDGNGSTAPKVVASLFLSPGGPKFINLMLHLANHVMLQDMKTFSTDGTWVPEAAAAPASSMEMAVKRLQLVATRFLRGAVEQDRLLQEYQKHAQSQVKSLRDWRGEDAKYDDLLKRHKKDADQEGTVLEQKIQKVRSLWSTIDRVLSNVEEERRVVECVIRGDVDLYILDGSDLTLKVPKVLLERMECLSNHSSVGSVYEAGQLNLLCMLELLNHALRLLGEERSHAAGHAPIPQLDPLLLQERSLQMGRALEDVRLMREKISKEEMPGVKNVIEKLEADWDRKWADILSITPLTSFLNKDPTLDFLSPMAPLSFEPATFRSGVFDQCPAKLLEFPEDLPTEKASDPVGTVTTVDFENDWSPAVEKIETPLPTSVVSSQPTTPLSALCETPLAVPVKAPSPSPQRASVKKTTAACPKMSAVKKKAQILDSECDNLANQFAEAVTASSVDPSIRGLELGDLLSTMGTDPFSTKKQLQRTPESLIMDVKSSWRRAVEEGEAQKAHLSGTFDGDGIVHHLTTLNEGQEASFSQDVLSMSQDPTCHSPSASQKRASLMSTLSWDSSNMEAFHSMSGSDEVQFSIAYETLPDLPGSDSLLSSSDGAPHMFNDEEEEESELLLPHIPSLTTEPEPVLLAARMRLDRIQQACSDASFMDNRKREPEATLPQCDGSLDTRDWLMATTVEAAGKVFSLDLDTLESPSPPSKEQYNLPQLITFSPIDDM